MSLHGSTTFSAEEVGASLECLDTPAMIISRELEILAVNRRFSEVFAEGREVLGQPCWEISHHGAAPCDRSGASCPVRQCRETGEPSRVVHVHYTPRGLEHEEITVYPILERDGTLKAFLEVIRPSSVAAAQPSRHRMVGRSPAFIRMLEMMRRVARRMTPVLLQGETGTGKELAARAIHELSPREAKPFVPVDCSGLSESLFESELFGHERGAFTGASGRKLGLVEASTGGTLFLDEVGDIPLSLQVKLLRLLESGVFRRVGSVDLVHSDFRLICATHRNLPEMVEAGEFRRDLYFRISVFPIELPPLRVRDGDLALLAESLLRQVGCAERKRIDPRTLAALEGYSFPGNIRELRNLMERACLLAEGEVILPQHLPLDCRREAPALTHAATPSDSPLLTLEEVERRYLAWVAESHPGSHRELAAKLGLSERTLYRKLRSLRQSLRAHAPAVQMAKLVVSNLGWNALLLGLT